MELLLPVALKLFPDMLPSTFEDKYAAVSVVGDQSTLSYPNKWTGREATKTVACQA